MLLHKISPKKIYITVEPSVRDHPKCKDMAVAYKNRTTGGLFREEVRAHLLHGRYFSCMQFQSSTAHTANTEIRESLKWSLTSGKKTIENHRPPGPKSGRGRC